MNSTAGCALAVALPSHAMSTTSAMRKFSMTISNRAGRRFLHPTVQVRERIEDQVAHEREGEERQREGEWSNIVPRIHDACGVQHGIERVDERVPRVPTQEAPEVNAERAQAEHREREQPARPPAE